MRQRMHIALLVGILVLNALLAYQPHISYPFPLLGDEYVHLSFARQITEEYELPFTNPYFRVPFPHINFESGFHLFLAGLAFLTPGELILTYKYLPVIFSVVNSVLMYALVRRLMPGPAAALIATFFFGTIKSTNGFLSHQYMLPLSVGMSLLLLAYIVFLRLAEKPGRKRLLHLLLILIALALTYPPALFFFLGTVILYTLSLDHTFHTSLGVSRKRFFTGAALGSGALALLGAVALHEFESLYRIVFTAAWDIVQTRLSPIFFFGVIPSTLAAIGLFVAGMREGNVRILIYWFFGSLGAVYFSYLTSFSILIPLPRLFLFYLMGVSALAGIGGAYILARLTKRRNGMVIGIALLVALGTFHYASVWQRPLEHRRILTPETYAALQFLNTVHGGDAVVIADSITSLGIYPASGKHVVNLLAANVGGGDARAARIVLNGSCEEKREVLPVFNYHVRLREVDDPPMFLLSKTPADCPFLIPLYERGPYVYELIY